MIDVATNSNAMIQDNPKGLMRKNAIHTEGKKTMGVEMQKKSI